MMMKANVALKSKSQNKKKMFTYGRSEKGECGPQAAIVRTQRGRNSTTWSLCDHRHLDAVDDDVDKIVDDVDDGMGDVTDHVNLGGDAINAGDKQRRVVLVFKEVVPHLISIMVMMITMMIIMMILMVLVMILMIMMVIMTIMSRPCFNI